MHSTRQFISICLIISLLTVSTSNVSAQYFQSKNYPTDYFRSPLNIPLQLSANFGEVRTNHWHMGLDIRTAQRENLPVYATADGFISRIKIEQYGYGRVIYISHPSGYTTLYAHLNNFYPELNQYILDKQYRDEQWEQDIYLPPGKFPVKKGQVIAYSGNTGGSAGPHLHFEVRKTFTENNVNPWFFDFNIPDNIAPTIYHFYYYDRRYSTYQKGATEIGIYKPGRDYKTKGGTVNFPSPQISFGIAAEDKTNNSPFRFGIYQAEVWMDGEMKFAFQLDDILYDDSRYVNAQIDFARKANGGIIVQHLSKLPGMKAPIFANGLGDGVFNLEDGQPHNFEVVTKDVAGNSSTLSFVGQYNPSLQKDFSFTQNFEKLIPNQTNKIIRDDIQVFFSDQAFYDTVPFVLSSQKPKETGVASDIFTLDGTSIPVQDSFVVRIKNQANIPLAMQDKIVMQVKTKRKIEAIKGIWKSNWMEAKFWDLGDIRLLIDTFPPNVSARGWLSGSNLKGKRSITLLVADDEGDIKNFRAELDGKWIMFKRKSDNFIHDFDERTLPGNHTLKIIAEDIAGNITEKTYNFTR